MDAACIVLIIRNSEYSEYSEYSDFRRQGPFTGVVDART